MLPASGALLPFRSAKSLPGSRRTGLVMLQLALPGLHLEKDYLAFRRDLRRYANNFNFWQRVMYDRLGAEETALLDVNGSAGWDLLELMLQSRGESREANGEVLWEAGRNCRVSAAEALRHRYFDGQVSRRLCA